jgi:hypothetical protein
MAVSHDFLACLGCAIIMHLKYKILDISNPRELKHFLGGVHVRPRAPSVRPDSSSDVYLL